MSLNVTVEDKVSHSLNMLCSSYELSVQSTVSVNNETISEKEKSQNEITFREASKSNYIMTFREASLRYDIEWI